MTHSTNNDQTFFVDFYGYKNYADNWQELTENFLNNGDYIDCDGTIDKQMDLKEQMENYKKEGTLITELFIKQRVLKGSPIFEHIAKGGKIALETIGEKADTDKTDKQIIYDLIAELYEYIQDGDYIENEYILEQLATMQNYAK